MSDKEFKIMALKNTYEFQELIRKQLKKLKNTMQNINGFLNKGSGGWGTKGNLINGNLFKSNKKLTSKPINNNNEIEKNGRF